MKRIMVPICNRTNYSKLKPILLELKKRQQLQLDIVLSSGIVVERIGNAAQDIKNDGLQIADHIDCLLMNDSVEAMSKTAGLSIIDHSSAMKRLQPDALLVVGDRFDMLPAVLSAKMMNIPILHIQGGEKSGSIDDYVRDIITICSSRHYVSTDVAREHVLQIAHDKTAFNFGCPSVEIIQQLPVDEKLDTRSFKKNYKHDFDIRPGDPFFLICVHPNTVREDIDMDVVLEACLSFNKKMIVLYPNVDARNSAIIDSIRKFKSMVTCVKHMPLEDFVKVMACTKCMIGNSSAGIREAASFGTPVVNIGDRQQNREKNKNTIDCPCDFDAIRLAISKSLEVGTYPIENLYYKPDCINNICDDVVSFLTND